MLMLERVIDFYAGHEGVEFATLGEAAEAARGRLGAPKR
jgi:hypothetical protein